jgi:hypothetical protein
MGRQGSGHRSSSPQGEPALKQAPNCVLRGPQVKGLPKSTQYPGAQALRPTLHEGRE